MNEKEVFENRIRAVLVHENVSEKYIELALRKDEYGFYTYSGMQSRYFDFYAGFQAGLASQAQQTESDFDNEQLARRLQSFLDRLCNDDYSATMFEGDACSLREAIEKLRHNYKKAKFQSQAQQPSEEFKAAALQELYNFQEATGCDVAAELKPHQLSQAQQSQWISVEERLPDSIRKVIGVYWHEEIGRFQQIFCCYDADDDDEWISYGDATPYPIRYWMESPLPPAPEGEKE